MERLEKQKLLLLGMFSGLKMYKAINAMNLATEYHSGLRKGGDPEVTHQFELVSYTVPLFEDKDYLESLVCIAFLHDIKEDYDFSEDQMKELFGDEITKCVMNVSKPSDFKKTPEFYARYYAKVSSHPFSMMVKMIDRLHNFESMLDAPTVFTLKKREAYIQEVLEFMIPAAKEVRDANPEYYQKLTFLIRLLKTYIKFLNEFNALEKNVK